MRATALKTDKLFAQPVLATQRFIFSARPYKKKTETAERI